MDHNSPDRTSNIYRQRKEDFIAGFEGTTITEITILLTCFPLVYYIYLTLNQLIRAKEIQKGFYCFVGDYLVLVFLPLAQVTFLSSYGNTVCFILASLAMVCYLVKSSTRQESHSIKTNELKESDLVWLHSILSRQHLPSLAYYRVALMIYTVICILAVDFSIFPRRFAKAEIYGTGLMDVGVGFFIFSSAITSPTARAKHGHVSGSIRDSIKSIVPIFVLGLIRLVSVKATAYHEHASEYGVHWNFFLTLAFTKVLCSVLLKLIPRCTTAKLFLLSSFVLASYQAVLSMGLSHFIHTISYNKRIDNVIDVIVLNAPGLASLCGYASLHLYGMACGRLLLHERDKIKQLAVLIGQSIVFGLMTAAVMTTIEDISRQLANASYVLWKVSLNAFLLFSFQLVIVMCSSSTNLTLSTQLNQAQAVQVSFGNQAQLIQMVKPELSKRQKGAAIPHHHGNNCHRHRLEMALGLDYPLLISCLNENQLLCFLFANVLTGAVNLSMQTMVASDIVALVVLTGYTLIVCLTLTIMKLNNINTKIW